MFNLAEFRKRPESVSDYLPYAVMPFEQHPSVMLQKDGSFLRIIQYRGPDLESTTSAALVSYYAKMNDLFRRLGSGWAIHLIADRFATTDYPEADWPCAGAFLFDLERRSMAQGTGQRLESEYVIALTYLPPSDAASRMERMLVEDDGEARHETVTDHVDFFVRKTDEIADLLSSFMPHVHVLQKAEVLTVLHHPLGLDRHRVDMPEVPMYLDCLLAEQPIWPGMVVGMGYTEDGNGKARPEKHIVTVGVRGYPSTSHAGMLDEMNSLNIEYRWSTRAILLDKQASMKTVSTISDRWASQRKGIRALVAEHIFNEPTERQNPEAVANHADASAALQEVAEGLVSIAYVTPTVTVWDEDLEEARRKAKSVIALIQAKGFVAQIETFNAFEAWLGSLPGSCYANVRQAPVNTMNLAHLAPLSATWAGSATNPHPDIDGPALMQTITNGSTPFRLNLHHGDVGHTVVFGPNGSGKSVLLSSVAWQWLRYDGARVYAFDKDRSIRLATLCAGGRFHELGNQGGKGVGFQPLAHIDDPSELTWALEWLCDIARKQNVQVTAEQQALIFAKLSSMATTPRHERTMGIFAARLGDRQLKNAFLPFTLAGAFGHLLDADRDELEMSRWQAFEMGELMQQPTALVPVLTYLFHRIERELDGSPTLMILDEAWLFLDDTTFAAKIRDWLKTMRKKNVSIVFATQSLADLTASKVAPAIRDNCFTRIYLPNAAAKDPDVSVYYRDQGLNVRQIDLISMAVPKRHYYYASDEGNRLFELGLGELGIALTGSSSPADHRLADTLLGVCDQDTFLPAFLRAKGLHWAADSIAQPGAIPDILNYDMPVAAE